MARDVFVLGGKRTPMGEYVGALKDVSAIELGAISARAALETTGVAPDEIDHTVFGNALQTSGDAIYGARHVALKAGVPFDRPALTVNRLCGSGIQSIVSGAQMIQLDEAQACLVGGMESMSQAPHVIRGARSGFALGQGKLEDSLMVALLDTYCNTPMAGTADSGWAAGSKSPPGSGISSALRGCFCIGCCICRVDDDDKHRPLHRRRGSAHSRE